MAVSSIDGRVRLQFVNSDNDVCDSELGCTLHAQVARVNHSRLGSRHEALARQCQVRNKFVPGVRTSTESACA